jgi:hypothetical protein
MRPCTPLPHIQSRVFKFHTRHIRFRTFPIAAGKAVGETDVQRFARSVWGSATHDAKRWWRLNNCSTVPTDCQPSAPRTWLEPTAEPEKPAIPHIVWATGPGHMHESWSATVERNRKMLPADTEFKCVYSDCWRVCVQPASRKNNTRTQTHHASRKGTHHANARLRTCIRWPHGLSRRQATHVCARCPSFTSQVL